ncbi:MAG: hypothetical protein DBY45_01815 [Clostridiales bacterium]|nr:MAG: hypothetical protein DBY45_01815 [Clostridiales bacterium]
MPTINKVIERVNQVRMDAFDDKTKAGWLLSLEGKLYRESILTHERLSHEPEVFPPPESNPDYWDTPLLVNPPYDRLYDLYLMAQIDFHNREMENYNNSALAFNEALDSWQKNYHRTHPPLSAGGFQNIW